MGSGKGSGKVSSKSTRGSTASGSRSGQGSAARSGSAQRTLEHAQPLDLLEAGSAVGDLDDQGLPQAPMAGLSAGGGAQGLIERTVTGLGYELVAVERSGRGLLRVMIDREPGRSYPLAVGPGDAVTIDDCELVTRQLQHLLEVENVPYERLEVSSPGLDRPLVRPADWVRFAGQAIELTLKLPFEGRKNWKGVLVALDVAPAPQAAADASTETETSAAQAPTQPRFGLLLEADKKAETIGQLEFTLDEVREARLVPVIDFKKKGRAGAGSVPRQGESAGQDAGNAPTTKLSERAPNP